MSYRQGAGILVATAALVFAVLGLTGTGGNSTVAASQPARTPAPVSTATATTTATRPATSPPPPPRLAVVSVQTTTIPVMDPTGTMPGPGGQPVQRSFNVIVRYPIAPAAPSFPLIVFGHGFAVTPQPYSLLLDAWARAGYVVAAPVFPLENANAPGGPNEKDLPNQPRDMTSVISQMLQSNNNLDVPVSIDPNQIAVAGQSDGGDTALATAYDPAVRDRRVKAAIILSGAEDPFAPPFPMPSGGPPLLAIQGTADTVNPPSDTAQFFDQASSPKYLLRLIGASHQPPYTEPGPDLTAVEQMTIAFLNSYFRHDRQMLDSYISRGTVGPGTALSASP